jgi:hypothetical protein
MTSPSWCPVRESANRGRNKLNLSLIVMGVNRRGWLEEAPYRDHEPLVIVFVSAA